MDKEDYDHLFSLFHEQKLVFESPISDDYYCCHCRQVLVNPHQSPCGCRFCHTCIRVILDRGIGHCPGDEDDCKLVKFSENTVFVADNNINRKILQMTFSCPNRKCQVKSDLKSLTKHLRLCEHGTVRCPYSVLGCQSSDMYDDQIRNHLVAESVEHAKFVVNSLENIMNDLAFIKNTEVNKSCDMESLTKDIKAKVDEIKNWENLKISYERKIFNQAEELREAKNALDEIKKDLSSLKMSKSFEYVWRIDKFFSKLQLAKDGLADIVSSETFYCHPNGYQLQLGMHPNGIQQQQGKCVFAGFRFIKGDYDEILQWPFEHEICLSVINQNSKQDHTVFRFQYRTSQFKDTFELPVDMTSPSYLGDDEFIVLSDIFASDDICKKDSIFVKLVVNFKK